MRMLGVGLLFAFVLGSLYLAGYGLFHPDMTEMRVSINNAGIIAVMFLCGIAGAVILGNTEDE